MKKRIFAALLIVLSLFIFASCGDKGDNTDDGNTDNGTSDTDNGSGDNGDASARSIL